MSARCTCLLGCNSPWQSPKDCPYHSYGPSEDAPGNGLRSTQAAEHGSAHGVDGSGPETGTAGSGTVHLVHDGYGTTRCCHRSPFELPTTERITYDQEAATCGMVPR